MKFLIIFLSLSFFSQPSAAKNKFGREFVEIDTCYHWMPQKYVQGKIDYALKNNGALYFHSDNVIYCWRSPVGAQNKVEDHGDVLVRIKFKPEVKIVHSPRQYLIGKTSKVGDILYSNDNNWQEYTITPNAIESWSLYHPIMIEEMRADYEHLTNIDDVVPNDYFWAINWYRGSSTEESEKENAIFLHKLMPKVIEFHEKRTDQAVIFGENPEDHFKTDVSLAWHSKINQAAMDKLYSKDQIPDSVPSPKKLTQPKDYSIIIRSASFGLNVSSSAQSNVTKKAHLFCEGKKICDYKVHPKFIGDPFPDQGKSFVIEWQCGENETIHTHKIPSPATNKSYRIDCAAAEAG